MPDIYHITINFNEVDNDNNELLRCEEDQELAALKLLLDNQAREFDSIIFATNPGD